MLRSFYAGKGVRAAIDFLTQRYGCAAVDEVGFMCIWRRTV